jgi:hypothetical protein
MLPSQVRTAAITFNPYYPAFDGTTYRAAYLDAAFLRRLWRMHSPRRSLMSWPREALYAKCFGNLPVFTSL